jgi:hypothetical protein
MQGFAKILVVSVFALLGMAGAASAASSGGQRGVAQQTFTSDSVMSILGEAGATNLQKGVAEGIPYVKGTDHNGFNFVALMRACEQTACRGIELAYSWRMDGKTVSLPSVNAFNEQYTFAKAFLTEGGNLVLSRLIIADGGITRDNVLANVIVFLQLPPYLFRAIQIENMPAT